MTKVTQHCEIYKNHSLENLPGEMWMDIEKYETCYQVSNMGRVKNLQRVAKHPYGGTFTVHEKILKSQLKRGYPTVVLSVLGKHKTISVHRLVATAFIENLENVRCVNHKNANRSDNRVENLEWVTHKGNTQHAIENNLLNPPIGERCAMSILNPEKVITIRELFLDGVKQKDIALQFGVAIMTINHICHSRSWKWIPWPKKNKDAQFSNISS